MEACEWLQEAGLATWSKGIGLGPMAGGGVGLWAGDKWQSWGGMALKTRKAGFAVAAGWCRLGNAKFGRRVSINSKNC